MEWGSEWERGCKMDIEWCRNSTWIGFVLSKCRQYCILSRVMGLKIVDIFFFCTGTNRMTQASQTSIQLAHEVYFCCFPKCMQMDTHSMFVRLACTVLSANEQCERVCLLAPVQSTVARWPTHHFSLALQLSHLFGCIFISPDIKLQMKWFVSFTTIVIVCILLIHHFFCTFFYNFSFVWND